MRKSLILFLLAGALILVWSGCAGQPEAVDKEQAPAVKEEAKDTEPAEPEMKKVVEEVQLVSKRSSYYSDGVLASYRVYTYAEEGTEQREEVMYNSDDEVEERITYSYEDGKLIEKQNYNGKGDLQRIHQYAYDENGFLLEDKLVNPKGETQTLQEFEYNSEGKKIKWSVSNGEGALLSYSIYEYEDGLNTKIENFSASGNLLDYFILEYNTGRNPIKRTWYDSDDQIVESRVYEYEEGALKKETLFRANGSVKRHIIYSNNSSGNPVEFVYMDAGENIQEQVTYEYINRTKVSYEPAE